MAAERAGGGGRARKTARKVVSDHDFVTGSSYAPAPESSAHVKIAKSYELFIGGKWVKAAKQMKTINPATEKVLSEVGVGGAKDGIRGERGTAKH